MNKELIDAFIELLKGKEGVISLHLKKETGKEQYMASEDYFLVLDGLEGIPVPLGMFFYDKERGAESEKDSLVKIKGNLLDIIADLESAKGLKGKDKSGIDDYVVIDHSGLIDPQATSEHPVTLNSSEMAKYYRDKLQVTQYTPTPQTHQISDPVKNK